MSLPYNGELIARARELRKEMTQQERKLWHMFLSHYPIRFQRQKVIGSFIVDFYCSKAMLAIEIDGLQHHADQGEAYDLERSTYLDSIHVMVIRFDNYAIDHDFEIVCTKVDNAIRARLEQIKGWKG